MFAALVAHFLDSAAPVGEARVVELRWDAPKRCPDEAALREQVDALLGGSLTTPRPRALSVIGVVRDEQETLALRVFTVSEGGMRERALRYDRDCVLLTRAAAVVIAITIDPAALGRLGPEALALLDPSSAPAPAPEPAPPPTPEPTPAPEPASAPAIAPTPTKPTTTPPTVSEPKPSPWRPRGALRVLGGAGVGELPGVGGGLAAAATLVFHRLRVEVVASLWPARHLRVNGTEADVGADFLLWSLGPRLCGVLHPHRLLEVPLCAGVEAGQVQVTSVGLADDMRTRVTWVAGVAAPALVVAPRRWLAVWLAPELVVPSRATYSIADVGPIYQASPVAGRFMAGIELRFP